LDLSYGDGSGRNWLSQELASEIREIVAKATNIT
jgi:hypothetical protein